MENTLPEFHIRLCTNVTSAVFFRHSCLYPRQTNLTNRLCLSGKCSKDGRGGNYPSLIAGGVSSLPLFFPFKCPSHMVGLTDSCNEVNKRVVRGRGDLVNELDLHSFEKRRKILILC